ncbi:HET-domain-containing protein [Xylariaceae sp. AK1471]|nr:HET-domain-containing protein [Xylariaceae sp. AK1471]
MCSSMAVMAPFQYQPFQEDLDEIRLVHLLPGKFNDPICICITHSPFKVPPLPPTPPQETRIQANSIRQLVRYPWTIEELDNGDFIIFNVVNGETHPCSMNSVPKPEVEHLMSFEALSYTWGEVDTSEFICVVSGSTELRHHDPATLGIRPNLSSALRYLRRDDETRIMWIDAICINQDDMAERNEQVKRMTHIYRFAHQVVVWLGEESDDSQHALTTLHSIGQQLAHTKGGRVIAAPNATQPHMWRNDFPVSFDQRTWQALIKLLERPWWYRVWTWQEILLSDTRAYLQCGRGVMPWNICWIAILCLHNKEFTISTWFRERCRHIAFLKTDSGQSINNILDINRSKGCADPRDKIYGILGMTPQQFSSEISVDYSKAIEDVYKEAFLAHLDLTKRSELLKHCDLAGRQIQGSSWVPDWSKTEFAAPILSAQLSSGFSRAWYKYSEPSVLELLGKRCAIVEAVSEVASKVEKETLLAVRAWSKILPNSSTYVTGETMEEAFALTVCMNRTRERCPYSHFLATVWWVRMLHQILCLTVDSQNDPIYEERETANTIQKVRGRRLFTTTNGYIGTAPAGIQPGDTICIILGAYSPIALRPTSSSLFQVIGECYIHGLEDAKAILGPLPSHMRAIIKGDAHGSPTLRFLDLRSGVETLEDPRLDPLAPSWVRAPYERLPGDPAIFEKFTNLETGEMINYDPRLSPDALEARGIELEMFKLV